MRRLMLATATLLAFAAPALADSLRDPGGRGFDPSGPDAEMLQAAAETGNLVNTNQASIAFQAAWYAEHGQNNTAPRDAGAPLPVMPKG